jgi:hypothetical protein
MIVPAAGIQQDAEHIAACFTGAEIFYAADGTSALVMSGTADTTYQVLVTESGTSSAESHEWSTGWTC